MYDIRLAEEEDIGSIYEIEKICFDRPWTYEMFTDELSRNDKARYFVIEYDKEIIGYAGYWQIIDEAHIMNIAVRPDFRKKGAGSTLIGFLLMKFREEGIMKATLEVRAGNVNAVRLYQKAGFRIAGKRKKYYDNKEDALIMWKEAADDNDTGKG